MARRFCLRRSCDMCLLFTFRSSITFISLRCLVVRTRCRWAFWQRSLGGGGHSVPFLPGMLRYCGRAVVYLGLGVAVQLWWLVRPLNLVTVTIGYTSLAFLYVSLLLLVFSQTSSIAARVCRYRWLRALGGISYCVYLIHLTINQLAHTGSFFTMSRAFTT